LNLETLVNRLIVFKIFLVEIAAKIFTSRTTYTVQFLVPLHETWSQQTTSWSGCAGTEG